MTLSPGQFAGALLVARSPHPDVRARAQALAAALGLHEDSVVILEAALEAEGERVRRRAVDEACDALPVGTDVSRLTTKQRRARRRRRRTSLERWSAGMVHALCTPSRAWLTLGDIAMRTIVRYFEKQKR